MWVGPFWTQQFTLFVQKHLHLPKANHKIDALFQALQLLLVLASKESILLDIGSNVEAVTGNKKQFYIDQKSCCKCCISEEINNGYEKEKKLSFKRDGKLRNKRDFKNLT